MKQNDKYKKNYNYVLKEIISLDKKCWGNLIKSYYEKSRNNGQKILRVIKSKKYLITQNRKEINENLKYIFDFYSPHYTPTMLLDILKLSKPCVFVETSSDESSDEE
tara:strand:- start:1339 stop:1659 length:321 start_codon:yes stop_codon:yes gene_type:complete